MKRLIVVSWCLCVPFIYAVAQSLSSKYNEQRPVVMVCDWDKPPYEFLNDKGEPAGSNIDVMKAVAKELGIPIKFVMKEWSIALRTFERGDADIVIANAKRYRREPYIVSDNIINYNRVRVATKSDSTQTISLKQLEREGAVFKPSDYSASYFMDGDSVNTSFMEFQTPKVALMGVLNGDYKYYVWGEEPLKWKIKELNLDGITLNDVGIPISEVHVVGRDRQLIEQIDDQYSRLKQRGDIAIIQDRWLHPERIEEEIDYSWIYITIAILIVAGILYFFSRLARRHVVNAMRASSDLNEMMIQALHMGNFIIMEYDIAHDRFDNRYGHVLPDSGMTLKEFTGRIHPDQRQEFIQKTRALLEGRERSFELNKRWNAGTEDNPNWLNFNGHAICELNSDGQPAYIVNAIHDVTHEMEEDQAARDLIHKYEVLSNIPFVAMAFYDKNGYLIALNDAMKELCGMTNNNDSQRFWENVSMFDTPLFRGAYSKESRDDVFFCQHMEYPEYGIDKYIEANIQPLFNAEGEIANYLCTAFDVSDDRLNDNEVHRLRKKLVETHNDIRRQHEQLEYLLANSERYLMHSDVEQEQITFFRTPDKPEHTYSFSRFQRTLSEEDRKSTMDILYDTTTRTPRTRVIHLPNPVKGEPDQVFSITFNPVFNQNDDIIGHDGIMSDITAISNTRQQLVEKTRLAEESVKKKSAFMASMTHELRTPLNAIVGFTSILEAMADAPERSKYVHIIRNSSDMLQRLIDDIIDASSITDGTITINPKDIDFAKEFYDICMTLAQRIQNSDVEFIEDNPYEHMYTTLDAGRVQQVLTNFVTNAVKFTSKGHIKVGYRYERHGLYCYCEDTGSGISLENQRVVFDRFVKLDEFVQGTGMGLAISKSIVERIGGEIGVISEGVGKGSTFWFWVPCERRLTMSAAPL